MDRKGLLLVFSGPSGAGKGTICRALQNEIPTLRLSVSATTRPPRSGEIEGKHYFFLEHEVFVKMIEKGQLLEWAEVYGNYYGTPLRYVRETLDGGSDIMLEIDIQGALQVKEKLPEAVLIFIAPPSGAELKLRLLRRGTDAAEEIEKRLACAAGEMNFAGLYDYIIINDEINRAVSNAAAIISAEKSKPHYLEAFLKSFMKKKEPCNSLQSEGSHDPTVS